MSNNELPARGEYNKVNNSAKLAVFIVCVSVSVWMPLPGPLPSWLFSSPFEYTLFRLICIVVSALVLWRDSHDIFRVKTSVNPPSLSTAEDKVKYLKSLKILYGSTTGNAKSLALALRKKLNTYTRKSTATVVNLKDYEPEDLEKEECIAIVVSTWNGGEAPRDAVFFTKFLEDVVLDFRRSKQMLNKLKFCVFGLGSSAYPEEFFCTASKNIQKNLIKLGANKLCDIGFGDDAQGDMDGDFAAWIEQNLLQHFAKAPINPLNKHQRNSQSATNVTEHDGKHLSKRQARLLRQKQNLERYGPSKTKIKRDLQKKKKNKPAKLEEEDLINDTFLSLPELQDQADDQKNKSTSSSDGTLDIEAIGAALHAQQSNAAENKKNGIEPREVSQLYP